MSKNRFDNQVIIAVEDFEIPLSSLNLPDIISVEKELCFDEATKLMLKHRLGSLVICEGDQLLGIFTERDCITKLELILENAKIPLCELMTTKMLTLSLNDSLIDALALMSSKGIRHVPIVNASGVAVKMLSAKDILHHVANLFSAYLADFKAISNWSKEDVFLQDDAILYDLKKEEGFLSEDILDVPLKRIYNPNVLKFDTNTPVIEVLKGLNLKKSSLALIFEYETEVKGVVTERDILYKVFANNLDLSSPIFLVMTQEPHLLSLNHQFGNAFKNMFTYKYRNVPVANSEGYAVGNVSLLELLIFLAGELGVKNSLSISSDLGL